MSRPPTLVPSPIPAAVPDASRRLLARWEAHRAALGLTHPTPEDFMAFGSASTLDRLRPALAEARPGEMGSLRLAHRELRRQRRASRAGGGQRGPAAQVTVPAAELPADWRAALAGMRAARDRLDRGRRARQDERRPPAAKVIGGIERTLRDLAQSCRAAGRPVEIRRRAVRLWLDGARARGIRPASESLYLRQIGLFLRWIDARPKLRSEIAVLARAATRAGEGRRKRKEERLAAAPLDLGTAWGAAEGELAHAATLPIGSEARVLATLRAAAAALAISAPLRAGDLAGLQIGETIWRDASGWRMDLVTGKTKARYERDGRWPKVTPFLDALVEIDAPGGDLWAGYEARQGTRLFSEDGGRTALTQDCLASAFRDLTGHGPHILRTLWHDTAAREDASEVWVALALCGQRSERTARHYRTRAARHEHARRGRAILAQVRRDERWGKG